VLHGFMQVRTATCLRARKMHTHTRTRARAHTHTHLRARQKHRKTHRNGREEEEEEEEFIASGNWVGWLRLENLRGNETRTRLLGLGLVRALCIDSTSGFLIYYQYSVRALNGGSPFWLPSSLRESWCGRGRSLGSVRGVGLPTRERTGLKTNRREFFCKQKGAETSHKLALQPQNETPQHEAHRISLLSNTSMRPLIRILFFPSLPFPP